MNQQESLPLTENVTRSQSAAILRDLKDGAVLDCMVILDRYQCNSGKQRIWDLRQAGWNIKGEWVELPNKKRIVRWHLDLTQPLILSFDRKKEKKVTLTRLRQLAKEVSNGDLQTELVLSRLIVAAEKE